MNVRLGAGDPVGVNRAPGRGDDGRAVGRRGRLVLVGCKEPKLVIGPANVPVGDDAGRLMVALGLYRKP